MSVGGAAPDNASLTLGFFGDQEVHRAHMKSLLDDFVEGNFKKSHRNAVVRCIICIDPFTSTMADLADWALTSGHHLGLIGHSDGFEREEISQLLPQAEGLIFKLGSDSIIGRALAATLASFDENRLILVADPNEDDDAYDAVDAARGRGVPVRSLLQGLERVVMDVDDEDQEQPPIHLVEDPEDGPDVFSDVDDGDDDDDDDSGNDPEEGDDEDDVVDRDEPPDLDDLADAADQGDVPAQEELKDLAAAESIDAANFGTWAEVVIAMRSGQRQPPEPEVEPEPAPVGASPVTFTDDGYFDVDAEAETADEEPGPEEEPEEEKVEPVAPKKWTQAQLERMDLEAIQAAGAEFGIQPGRGMKHAVFVRRILEAQGDQPAKATRRPTKKTAKKKAAPRAAKKAPVKKKAAAKKAPARKVTAAKKTPRKAAPRRTAPVAAAAPSTNGVDRKALRAFIKVAQEALTIAEQLS